MSQDKVILFLECDGIFEPVGTRFHYADISDKDGATDGPLALGALLNDLLKPFVNHVEIVISDQCALSNPIDILRARLPSVVASRVIESMYLPELSTSVWSDYFSALATRYACMRLWLDRKRPNASNGWLALEQQGRQVDSWPTRDRDHVVWGSLGRREVQEEFIKKLQHQMQQVH